MPRWRSAPAASAGGIGPGYDVMLVFIICLLTYLITYFSIYFFP